MKPSNEYDRGQMKYASWAVVLLVFIFLLDTIAYATPIGPDAAVISSTIKSPINSSAINGTVGGESPGGYIFSLGLDGLQQNPRWKGYVGNVTGTLTLDDSSDNTFFDWSLTEIEGEVYATRDSGMINWSGLNCTWIADGIMSTLFRGLSSRTPEHNENVALNHTSPDDNITATFTGTNHSSFFVGSREIGKNQCFTIQTYQADSAQVYSDSDDANFTQIVMYDGSLNKTSGSLVYVSFIEENNKGFNPDEKYDFQMLIPENAIVGYVSSTAYYFYVELA